MPPVTTLKRQAGADVNFSDDDLDEKQYEVTWGNKKTKYFYSYNLQSPDLFSNINDSDQTKNVYSQLKTTIEIEDAINYSSDSCSYEHDDHDGHSNNQNSSQPDSTDTEDTEKEIILGIDNGYLADENLDGILITTLNPPTPAFFKNCVNCANVNNDPHYQYCCKCFKYREQLFEDNPNPIRKKRIKHLNQILNSQKHSPSSSEETSQSTTQESGTFGLSGLCVSDDKLYSDELCNVCFLKPKNGIFNHRKTGHVYCCYDCSKQIWIRSGHCPICNLKIRYVTRAIVV